VQFSLGGKAIALTSGPAGTFFLNVSGSDVQKLPYLTVSSSKFFGVNSLNQDT